MSAASAVLHRHIDARLAPVLRRPAVLLFAHFFRRFFDSDLVAGEGDNTLGIGGVFALLAVPGLLIPLFLFDKYSTLRWYFLHRKVDPWAQAVPDMYLFVNLAMVLAGMLAVLKWDSLFPDRRDIANLGALPIGATRVLYTKAAALGVFVFAVVLDANAAPTILFPGVVLSAHPDMHGAGSLFLSQAVAVLSGSLFTFCAFAAIIGCLMVVVPQSGFRTVSRYARVLSMALLFGALCTTTAVQPQLARMRPDSMLRFMPAVWFAGLDHAWVGKGGAPVLAATGDWALPALAIAAALAVVSYVVAYRWFYLRIPENPDVPRSAAGLLGRRFWSAIGNVLSGPPAERAAVRFALATLSRSERHWMAMGAMLSFGITVAAGAAAAARIHANGPDAIALSIPLIVVFFVVAGLRYVFDMAAELRANWAFQIAAPPTTQTAATVCRIIMLLSLAPVLLATLAVSAFLFGIALALEHTAFVALASVSLVEIALLCYRKIPFTCAKAPGKHNAAAPFAVFFIGFFLFSYNLADLERWLLDNPVRFAAGLCALAALWLWLRRYAHAQLAEAGPVEYEEEIEPAIRTLGLG